MGGRAVVEGASAGDTPFEGAGELVAGVGGTLGSAGSETVREATAERARGPHVFLVNGRADTWQHTSGASDP